jgi:protein TonB
MQATRPRGAGLKPHPAGAVSPPAAHAATDIVVISTRDDFLLELGAVLGATTAVRSVDSLSMALEQMGASRRAHIFVFDTRGMADLRNCVGRAYARAPDGAILLFADAADVASMRRMFKGSKVLAVLPIPMDPARTALIFADALTDAMALYGPAPVHTAAAPARTAAVPVHTEAVPVHTEAVPARTAAAPSVPIASLTPSSGAALVILACAWFIAADKQAILPGAAPAKTSTPAEPAPVNGSADAHADSAKAAQQLPAPASAPPLQAPPQVASAPPGAAVPQSRLDLIRYVVPEYPAAQRAHHVSGIVSVAYTVDTHGATRHVRVISAEPRAIFDRDAVNAVRLWRYAPVMVDNAAVAVATRSTIRFTPPPALETGGR